MPCELFTGWWSLYRKTVTHPRARRLSRAAETTDETRVPSGWQASIVPASGSATDLVAACSRLKAIQVELRRLQVGSLRHGLHGVHSVPLSASADGRQWTTVGISRERATVPTLTSAFDADDCSGREVRSTFRRRARICASDIVGWKNGARHPPATPGRLAARRDGVTKAQRHHHLQPGPGW